MHATGSFRKQARRSGTCCGSAASISSSTSLRTRCQRLGSAFGSSDWPCPAGRSSRRSSATSTAARRCWLEPSSRASRQTVARCSAENRSSGSRSQMETWSGRARQTAGMTHHVISTMAIPYVTKLIPDLPDAHRAKLDTIRNIGVVCVVLKLRKSVTPHFWVNINDACRGAGHCRVLEPQADA